MLKRSLFASSLLAASISTAIAAPYGSFDARSLGMGNTSVATGSMSSAAFSNPALLVNNVSDDSFIISIGGGLTLLDNGGVIDTIDNFQAAEDDFAQPLAELQAVGADAQLIQTAVTTAEFAASNPTDLTAAATALSAANDAASAISQYLVNDQNGSPDLDATLANVQSALITPADTLVDVSNIQIDALNKLAGASLLGTLSPGLMIGYAGDTYSFAMSAKANAFFSGGVDRNLSIPSVPLASDLIAESQNPGGNVGALVGNPTGTFRAIGAVTTEIGLSIASKLTLAGMDMAVGVKPKMISAQAISYSVNLETFDTGDIAEGAEDLGSFTTFDAGITLDVSESFRVGFMGINLISKELKLANGGGIVNFDTKLRVGAAYNNSFMTFSADMDLSETKPILYEDPTKMLALGLELNAFNVLQLRFGYQDNMASGATADPLLSAGVGLWLLGFDLQLAAVGNADSVGVFVQTGVRF